MEFYLNIAGMTIEFLIALILGIYGGKNVYRHIRNDFLLDNDFCMGNMGRNHHSGNRKKRKR